MTLDAALEEVARLQRALDTANKVIAAMREVDQRNRALLETYLERARAAERLAGSGKRR